MLCPDCPTARLTRALVFDQAFRENLVLAFLPFIVTWIGGRTIVRRLER